MDENAKGMSSLGDALLRIYEIERGLWGDLISTMLMRTILQGVLEHRPYDSTALAARLDLPAQTVSRRVANLVDRGWVRREKVGRSYLLIATPQAQHLAIAASGDLRGVINKAAGQIYAVAG